MFSTDFNFLKIQYVIDDIITLRKRQEFMKILFEFGSFKWSSFFPSEIKKYVNLSGKHFTQKECQ